MTEIWSQWEHEIINGAFPLRSLLGSSDHSAVFLTEYPAQGLTEAAIKIVAVQPGVGLAPLARWEGAQVLAHPHLVSLFEYGRCQRDGRDYQYVVMEYADETLAEILPMRALTPNEVQEMLNPTLEALRFLHSRNFVHGGLKPTNLMVIGDQVKLAADTVHSATEASAPADHVSPYDPPEGRGGRFPTAADMWALGVTMVEALTQRTPAWSEGATVIPTLPAETPSPLAKAVRRCLHRSPAARPSAADLDDLLKGVAQAPLASASEAEAAPEPQSSVPIHNEPAPEPIAEAYVPAPEVPVAVTAPSAAPAAPPQPVAGAIVDPSAAVSAARAVRAVGAAGTAPASAAPASAASASATSASATSAPAASRRPSSTRPPRKNSLFLTIGLLVVIILIWALLHALRGDRNPPPPAAQVAPEAPLAASQDASTANIVPPTPAPQTTAPAPAPKPANQATAESSYVRHLELPVVSRSASDSIHGHFGVAVRVTLDTAGNVIDETLEQPGPSQYFARRAMTAARQWRFARADLPGTRESLLWFEFSRDGVTAHADTPSPVTP